MLSHIEDGALLPGRPPRCLRFRSPAHGQTAEWSYKRSRTWTHKGHCVSWVRKGMRSRCCKAVRMRSTSQSKRRELGPPAPGTRGSSTEIRSPCGACCITRHTSFTSSSDCASCCSWRPCWDVVDGAAELCTGGSHVWVGCGDVGVVLQLEAKKAAGSGAPGL